MNNIVNEIKDKGYYILKNYYNEEKCNNIKKDINNIKNYNIGEGGDIRVVRFEEISSITKGFLDDPYFLSIGKELMGHNVDGRTKRCQLGIVKYNTGKECSGGGWHVDCHNPQFKAILYLTDVNKNNGPFAIISPPINSKDYEPISQEKNTRFSDKIEKDYKDNIHILTGNMGDVILVMTSNIHRGTIIKEGERLSLTNYYYDGVYST